MSSLELSVAELTACGLPQDQAEAFVAAVGKLDQRMTPSQVWQWITRNLLRPEHPMEVHEHLQAVVFADWDPADGPAPAWFPEDPDSSNIAWLMRMAGKESYRDLHAWSVSQRQEFWATMVERLEVQFREPFSSVLDLSGGPEHPRWLVGAKLNIVDSCFRAPDDSPAVIYQAEDGPIERLSVAELRSMAGRVANGLAELGIKADDRVAIDMPMTVESVAIYLGAVAAGCPVVAVADSFAPAEIAVRLGIGQVRCIFTQDFAVFASASGCHCMRKYGPPARRRRSSCRAAGLLTASFATGTLPGKTSFPTGRTSRQCLATRTTPPPSCSRRARAARPRPFPGTRPRRSNPPLMRTCITTSTRATCSAGRATWAG